MKRPPAPVWLKRVAARLPFGHLARFGAEGPFRKEYAVALPEGFGARRVVVQLTIPPLPPGPSFSFSEHVTDETGLPTDRVIACMTGGFAISDDLAKTWREVKVRRFSHLVFLQSKVLRPGEILFVASDPADSAAPSNETIHLIVCDERGSVLHSTTVRGARWHGPRSVDVSANTLMYAEYTSNQAVGSAHYPSRVWRSRDFGRSWEKVFEQSGVRHFHFLQARPGRPGEWWLTSGDSDEESRIWRSLDDGESWADQTGAFGALVEAGGFQFSRRIFRLTDLVWAGDDIVWGCDDVLNKTARVDARAKGPLFGSRMFRGNPSSGTPPDVLGRCGPEVRNIVTAGDFEVIITQSSGDKPPGVHLMHKTTTAAEPKLCKLFDIDRTSELRSGFTYSRASRAAKDGTFFSFRSAIDVFHGPGRILQWNIDFD